MQYAVRLFVLSPAPGAPETFAVEAPTLDDLREVVLEEIQTRKLKLRALSFGPRHIVVYAEMMA